MDQDYIEIASSVSGSGASLFGDEFRELASRISKEAENIAALGAALTKLGQSYSNIEQEMAKKDLEINSLKTQIRELEERNCELGYQNVNNKAVVGPIEGEKSTQDVKSMQIGTGIDTTSSDLKEETICSPDSLTEPAGPVNSSSFDALTSQKVLQRRRSNKVIASVRTAQTNSSSAKKIGNKM